MLLQEIYGEKVNKINNEINELIKNKYQKKYDKILKQLYLKSNNELFNPNKKKIIIYKKKL